MFDTVITIYKLSTAKNSLGEDVRSYASIGTQRAMTAKLEASSEEIEKQTNKTLKSIIKVWTWYNVELLDTTNQVAIDGITYDIDDASEVYGRKRFIRLKLIQYI